MSHVTDIVIFVDPRGEQEAIDSINDWLDNEPKAQCETCQERGTHLLDISEHLLAGHTTATQIFARSINHLNTKGFYDLLMRVKWNHEDYVFVVTCDEDGEFRFGMSRELFDRYMNKQF